MNALSGGAWFLVGLALGAGAVYLISVGNKTSNPIFSYLSNLPAPSSYPPIDTSTKVKEP